MKTVFVSFEKRGTRVGAVMVAAEAIQVRGPLAVTRALVPFRVGAEPKFATGRYKWTVTHLRTGWSLTQGKRLARQQAIDWLERALRANNWARETSRTWARRSPASKRRIWLEMTGEAADASR